MHVRNSTAINGLLLLCAVIGVVIIFLPARYGTRIWDDGFNYISPARSLIRGDGFLDYTGAPYVKWAPLYPVILALAGIIFNQDPLMLVYFLNALIFGLIVYCGGALSFRHLSSSPVLAICGTLAILFSIPLFEVSTQAWSEPIFIVFMLLSLRFAGSYILTNDKISLILLSLTVALACLQRYVGISLIIWGALMVFIFRRGALGGRLAHLALFVLISAVPLGAWFIRNAIAVGGALATREPSQFTVLENLAMARQSIISWYGPSFIGEIGFGIIVVSLTIGVFAGIREWPDIDVLREKHRSTLFIITNGLFCTVFVAFVVTACASTQCLSRGDNSRTFSPMYIPLTLLFLVAAQMLIARYLRGVFMKILNVFLAMFIIIWLNYPIRTDTSYAINLIQKAQRINIQAWRHSETIQYLLRHHNLDLKCKVYTNDVMSTFILARISAERSLNQLEGGGEGDIAKLLGLYPPDDKACLVWYNHPSGLEWFPEGRGYFTLDVVQQVANTKLIVQLEDGVIYWMTRK